MVKSATVDAVLSYLKPYPNYSIWTAALEVLRSQVEASEAQQVLFAASDNQSCRLQGWSSGGFWASRDSTSFLCQVVVLPAGWPNVPVRFYDCDTLATDPATGAIISVQMRTSPQSFILPSGDAAVAVCDRAIPRPCGSALALRSSFLSLSPPSSPLSEAIAALSPELSYFTQWLRTAGLGMLPASPGTYTLLAPTNRAFEVLAASIGTTAAAFVASPACAMASYHVAAGTFGPFAVESAPPANAVASDGFLLTFQCANSRSHVNSAVIDVSLSQVASNGILYVIDAVLSHGVSGPCPTFSS
jgi:hypothetical protein